MNKYLSVIEYRDAGIVRNVNRKAKTTDSECELGNWFEMEGKLLIIKCKEINKLVTNIGNKESEPGMIEGLHLGEILGGRRLDQQVDYRLRTCRKTCKVYPFYHF